MPVYLKKYFEQTIDGLPKYCFCCRPTTHFLSSNNAIFSVNTTHSYFFLLLSRRITMLLYEEFTKTNSRKCRTYYIILGSRLLFPLCAVDQFVSQQRYDTSSTTMSFEFRSPLFHVATIFYNIPTKKGYKEIISFSCSERNIHTSPVKMVKKKEKEQIHLKASKKALCVWSHPNPV